MNLLLDTHTLIWLAEADNNLSQPAKSAIENPEKGDRPRFPLFAVELGAHRAPKTSDMERI